MRARARLALVALLAAQAAMAATADLERVMSALAQRKHCHVTFSTRLPTGSSNAP
jgi:hypothetical protein